MKSTILISLLIFSTISYNPDAAVKYARIYCHNYNPAYSTYNSGSDCANFVSQCLIAGGMDLTGCDKVRNNGVILGVTALKNCLIKKGWHESKTKPPNFRSGYIMAKPNLCHVIIATSVEENKIKYCGHTQDVCEKVLNYEVIYIYP